MKNLIETIKQNINKVALLAGSGLLLPAVSYCQAGPPPPGDVPDVPFDSNMNLVFLAAGVVFAAVVIARRLRKKSVVKL